MAVNPYENVLNNLERTSWDYNNRLRALQAKRNSIGWFANVADALEYNKLTLAVQNLGKQIENVRSTYQNYNNSIIEANTKWLWIDYQNLYNAVAWPTLAATDRYIYNTDKIYNQATKDSAKLLEQNIADSNALANRQVNAVNAIESNQAGIVWWIGTRAWLNAWQIIAWQDMVNADRQKQLADIEQSRFNNVQQQRANFMNLYNQYAQVQQWLEWQRLQNIQWLNNTALQIQQAQLAKNQQDALMAQQKSWGGWWTYNPSLPNVPKSSQTNTWWLTQEQINQLSANLKKVDLSMDWSPTYILEDQNSQPQYIPPTQNISNVNNNTQTQRAPNVWYLNSWRYSYSQWSPYKFKTNY